MLPTEAQWEYAARGTGTTAGRLYPWGNEKPKTNRANYGGNQGKITPVGCYREGATPEGLLDMAGNVWEWCRDWTAENSYGDRNGFAKDPEKTDDEKRRNIRGGTLLTVAEDLVAAVRAGTWVWDRSNIMGFRCIVVETEPN